MLQRRLTDLLFVLLLLAGSLHAAMAFAAPRDDGYVSGYATAMLERDFRLPAPSPRVQDAVSSIDATALGVADRAAVVSALSRIRGAQRVVVVDAPPAAPPAPTSEAPSTATPATGRPPLQPGLFPGGHLFDPLIADP